MLGDEIIYKEFKEDTVVRLLASKGYTIDGSTVQIMLPDTEEMNAITRTQFAVAAILLDQYMLENGLSKESSMVWLNWAGGVRGKHTLSISRGDKEVKKAFEWHYKTPIKENDLIEKVRSSMAYLSDYDLEKLNEIDYAYISAFFGEEITSKELLPEIPAVKRIGNAVVEAIGDDKYSYQLYETYGITD